MFTELKPSEWLKQNTMVDIRPSINFLSDIGFWSQRCTIITWIVFVFRQEYLKILSSVSAKVIVTLRNQESVRTQASIPLN